MTARRGSISQSEQVLIVVPAYNEARNLAPVLRGVRAAVPDADVLVVDDGSTDETGAVARRAGASVVCHAFNLGYGAALQTGFKYALARRYEYVVHLDGDGQHEPSGIHDVLRGLRAGTADVIVGSRYLGRPPAWIGFARHWGSRCLALLTSQIVGQRITDPTSGFQGCNRRAVRFYALDGYPVDYPDADVLIMLHRAGFRVAEVPVTMYGRASGRSMHAGARVLYYGYKMMLTVALAAVGGWRRLGREV